MALRRFQWVKRSNNDGATRWLKLEVPRIPVAPFPLTLNPSPLGRGKYRWRRPVKPRLPMTSSAGERVSLSLRERVGVRGNSARGNPRLDVMRGSSLSVIPLEMSKNLIYS